MFPNWMKGVGWTATAAGDWRRMPRVAGKAKRPVRPRAREGGGRTGTAHQRAAMSVATFSTEDLVELKSALTTVGAKWIWSISSMPTNLSQSWR